MKSRRYPVGGTVELDLRSMAIPDQTLPREVDYELADYSGGETRCFNMRELEQALVSRVIVHGFQTSSEVPHGPLFYAIRFLN